VSSWLLVVAFFVAVGSAVFPPISIELFVLGLGFSHPNLPWLAFGVVIGVGQTLGKLVYFYAGRGDLRLPAFLHKRTAEPKAAPPDPGWWRRIWAWFGRKWAWLKEKCQRHPHWMVTALAVSSLIGLPPLIATTVLAGLARLSLRTFVAASLPGRVVRFSVLAASPVLVHHWMHVLHIL
jgi:membrane protein YqaA with SNARE-associated domain